MGLRNPTVYKSISAFAPICNPSVVSMGQNGKHLWSDGKRWTCGRARTARVISSSTLVDVENESGVSPNCSIQRVPGE